MSYEVVGRMDRKHIPGVSEDISVGLAGADRPAERVHFHREVIHHTPPDEGRPYVYVGGYTQEHIRFSASEARILAAFLIKAADAAEAPVFIENELAENPS